jgi:hypothetical protein
MRPCPVIGNPKYNADWKHIEVRNKAVAAPGILGLLVWLKNGGLYHRRLLALSCFIVLLPAW